MIRVELTELNNIFRKIIYIGENKNIKDNIVF